MARKSPRWPGDRFQFERYGNLWLVFGPLNGVRVALVAAAAVAALAALVAGYVGAALVLLVGILVHGIGWLYLYNQRTYQTDPD